MLQTYLLLALVCFLSANGSHVEDDCRDKIELGLLIDVSSSHRMGEWSKVKQFWTDFLDYYHIDANRTSLGVITYAKQPKLLFNLQDKEYQSFKAAKIAIFKALKKKKSRGKPLIEKALLKAHDVLFKLPPRNNTQRVLFVFSGGKSKTPNTNFYEEIARSVEYKGVNMVAVSRDENDALKIVVTRGHAVFVEDISDSLSKLQEIVKYTCLIHGGYAEWNEWGVCSKTCGGGSQTRHRTCSNPLPSENGKNCDDLGPSAATRPCNNQACGDIDGGYSQWTAWSSCSHTCGGGRKERHRLCVNPPQQDNGKFCEVLGPSIQTKKCKKIKCKGANIKPCEQGLDLGIVIDQSLSVRQRNLESLLKTFFSPYITKFQISKSKTHVGLIRFHRTSHVDFNFGDYRFYSPEKLKNQITNIDPVTIYLTRIDRALLSARYELFTPRGGDRKNKQNVLLVLTDGRPFPPDEVLPFNETIPPLREEKKVHMVAVGYGPINEINRTVLEEIGGNNVLIMHSNPDSGYASYASQIKDMICAVDGGYTQWSFWSLCSASCGAGTQTRSRSCTAPPKRKGGEDCKGDFVEVRACGEVYCPHVPPSCKNLTLDLAIVLEASNELGLQHFLSAKEFINKLLQLYDISPTGTHVSLVLFNKMAHSVISFDQAYYQNRDLLNFVLQYLPPALQSGKRLDEALKYVNESVFSTERGDRPDVKDVVVFLTDGRIVSGNDISDTVSSLRGKNVNMATVSFETEIREEVLYEIAGSKMSISSSFPAMVAKVEHVASIVCDIEE